MADFYSQKDTLLWIKQIDIYLEQNAANVDDSLN
jgi:hypothetical protein